MAELDLNIRYKPGRRNANADALSRAPVGDCHGEDDRPDVVVAVVDGDEVEEGAELEIRMLQEADEEVVKMVRLVEERVLPSSESWSKKLMVELSRLALIYGVLWCMDSARGSMPRLVMPSENQGKNLELALPYHGPYTAFWR